ncbi:hypothetical protein Bbelb_048360 [Branchiostoma belcheri]|nr:hypothetical protein Bbelb_048360 [Branchiostoma belcheri]
MAVVELCSCGSYNDQGDRNTTDATSGTRTQSYVTKSSGVTLIRQRQTVTIARIPTQLSIVAQRSYEHKGQSQIWASWWLTLLLQQNSSEDDTSSTKSDPLMVNIEEGNPADNAADTPNDPVHPEDMSDPPNHPVEQEDIGDDIDSSDDSSEAEDDATYSSNTSSSDEEVAAAAQNDPDPNDPLYPNAHLDMKTAVAILAAWFATSTLTEKKFADLLKIFHYFLPPHNIIPTTTKKFKKVIKQSVITKHKSHICPRGCFIYAGENARIQECPVCGLTRYKEGTHQPRKVFHYYSIREYLHWLFQTHHFGTLVQTHATRPARADDDSRHDIQDTSMWRGLYAQDGMFRGETRGLALSISVDGISPFRTNPKYCMWPIVVTIENLPRSIRNDVMATFLYGTVSGPRKPNNLDIYLKHMVHDLVPLSDGVPNTTDVASQETFTMQARVVCWKADYEGHKVLLKVVGANGLSGCDKCRAMGVKPAMIRRTIFPQNRCHLPQDSHLREAGQGHFLTINEAGQVQSDVGEDRTHPRPHRTHQQMVAAGEEVVRLRGQHRRAEANRLQKQEGICGVSEVCRIPYMDMVLDVPVDPMHVIAGFTLKLLTIITTGGNLDGTHIRQFERNVGRFDANILPRVDGDPLPLAPWQLSDDDIRVADERRAAIRGITGNPFRPEIPMFVDGGSTLKSEELLQAVAAGPLKYCLRDMLGDDQREAVFAYCHAISEIVDATSLDNIQDVQTMLFHLHHHLGQALERFGTMQAFWLFPVERRHHAFKQMMKSGKHPEASLMNRFQYVLAGQAVKYNQQLPADLMDLFEDYIEIDDFERAYNRRQRQGEREDDYAHVVIGDTSSHMRFSDVAQRLGANRAGSFHMLFGDTQLVVLDEEDTELLADFYSLNNSTCEERPEVVVYQQAAVPDVDRQYVIQLRTQWWEEEAPRRSHPAKTTASYLFARFTDDNAIPGATNEVQYGGETQYYWLGRIVAFWFHDRPQDRPEQLVKVKWFAAPRRDEQSNLWYVDSTQPSSGMTVENIFNIRTCLALIAKEEDRIWVLSIYR